MKKKPALTALTSAILSAALLASPFGYSAAQATTASTSKHQITGSAIKHAKLKEGSLIAKVYVPRYGKKYVRTVLQGTSHNTLNNKAGLGHYDETSLPGQEGNFAIAGHRFANGGPMLKIDKLTVGDYAYVKTPTTWYTYKYLQTKVVDPNNVGVIYPVPKGLKGAAVGGHYMTFTSCTPVHINTHRIAAWFELVEEQPVADGMPAALATFLGK